MRLKTYIDEIGQSAFARQIGVSKQTVNHWVHGRQKPTPEKARIIEVRTDGVVTREDVRPDIFA
ncbi:MAG: helix-turn-helix domain-containing protein [Desulfobulbaceae bacterium]|nr:helix-turn-helix domain-containing protein [Desulfobulbaceae bacterium]